MQISTTIKPTLHPDLVHLTTVCDPVNNPDEARGLQDTLLKLVNTDRVGAVLDGQKLTLKCFVSTEA